MTPQSPVVPGFEAHEIVFAKDQTEVYLPLPALVYGEEHTVLTRWRLSWWERLVVLVRGNLYLEQYTFGARLQPQRPAVHAPALELRTREG